MPSKDFAPLGPAAQQSRSLRPSSWGSVLSRVPVLPRLTSSKPRSVLRSFLIEPSSAKLCFSYCVKVVESRWLSGVQLVCFTHNQPGMQRPRGINRRLAPMFSCDVPSTLPQPLHAFNSYVFCFSPPSTGLIRTSTKYLNQELL